MVASDGGLFTFGGATIHGATGSLTLQAPVTGRDPMADDPGCWLAATDGGGAPDQSPVRGVAQAAPQRLCLPPASTPEVPFCTATRVATVVVLARGSAPERVWLPALTAPAAERV